MNKKTGPATLPSGAAWRKLATCATSIPERQQGLAMIEQSLAAAPIGVAVATTAFIGPKLPPFQGD